MHLQSFDHQQACCIVCLNRIEYMKQPKQKMVWRSNVWYRFCARECSFFSVDATLIWLMWACYINNYSAYANQITVNWLNVFLLGEWRSVQCAPLSAIFFSDWKCSFFPRTSTFFSQEWGAGGSFFFKVTKCFLFDSLNFHCKQRCKMLIACSYFYCTFSVCERGNFKRRVCRQSTRFPFYRRLWKHWLVWYDS